MVEAVNCLACGNRFTPRQTGIRCCSKSCAMKERRARGIGGRPRLLADRGCDSCSVPFRPLYRDQRFCSVSCRIAAQSGTRAPRLSIDRPAIVEQYRAGAFTKDLAAAFGCSVDTVRRIVARADVSLRRDDAARQLRGRRGSQAPGWKGGRLRVHGYVWVFLPDHPSANKKGYVAEHRLVWENARGPIPPLHDVHHWNRIKDDNRIENLELLSKSAHHRLHAADPDANWRTFTPEQRHRAGLRGAAAKWGKPLPE